MNIVPELDSSIKKVRTIALLVGVVASVVTVISFLGAKEHPQLAQFFQSYLQAFILWIGIPCGSLALMMIHQLAGGGWSHAPRRIFEAAAKTLPFMLLLFVPIALNLEHIYRWADMHELAHNEILQFKQPYLNETAFIVRGIICFALWIVFTHLLCHWSTQQDLQRDDVLNRRMRVTSGLGIVVFSLSMTVSSWDWTMSLEPEWFSSMWGPLFGVGQILSALALAAIVLARLAKYKPIKGVIKPAHFHNLGNMCFAFIILWTYMSFAQFIIIWSGNLPEEITWYLVRTTPGWKMVAVFLALVAFALPFGILLSRYSKLNEKVLATVALVIILPMRLVDNFWVIAPSFDREGVSVNYLDFLIPIAMGGLWLYFFLGHLRKQSLLPKHDPRFEKLFR